ncbi:MAG: STAS-like domain-containing protein [bacterium]|nr:STAS-like domain-containing protein [bacterium]
MLISIAKDFTTSPGARYKKYGKYSGEEFRETILKKYFSDKDDKTIITIDLDGTYGYGSSFLEECFGGLAREYGSEVVLQRLRFISNDDKLLVDEIKGYINDAD